MEKIWKQLENCLVVDNGIGYVLNQSCFWCVSPTVQEIILIVSAVFGPCFRFCFRPTADSELVTSHQMLVSYVYLFGPRCLNCTWWHQSERRDISSRWRYLIQRVASFTQLTWKQKKWSRSYASRWKSIWYDDVHIQEGLEGHVFLFLAFLDWKYSLHFSRIK